MTEFDQYVWLYEVLKSTCFDYIHTIAINTPGRNIIKVVIDPIVKNYMYIDDRFVAIIEDKKHICFIVTSYMILNKIDVNRVTLIPFASSVPLYIYHKSSPCMRVIIERQDELTDIYTERQEFINLRTLF